MKRQILLLPISLLVLSMRIINAPSNNITNAIDTSNVSIANNQKNNNREAGTEESEYIPQQALDSLKGKLKVTGEFALSVDTYYIYNEEKSTYSSVLTSKNSTILGGDNYYTYRECTHKVERNYQIPNESDEQSVLNYEEEVYATNVNGKIGLYELDSQNMPFPRVYEYMDLDWDHECGKLFKDLDASNFIKQSDGSYKAIVPEDRWQLTKCVFINSFEMELYDLFNFAFDNLFMVPEVFLKVSNNIVTEINYNSDITHEYSAGRSTVVFSGTAKMSDHGTAIAPIYNKEKPVLPEHEELKAALASLKESPSLKRTTTVNLETSINTGEKENIEGTIEETFTPSLYYYSTTPSLDTTKKGYIKTEDDIEYSFDNLSGKLELTNYSSNGSVSIGKDEQLTGYSVALFDYKGNGVFETYEDTVDILDSYFLLDYDTPGCEFDRLRAEGISITIKEGKIESIKILISSYYYTGEIIITYDTENIEEPEELNEVKALAKIKSSIYSSMGGIWEELIESEYPYYYSNETLYITIDPMNIVLDYTNIAYEINYDESTNTVTFKLPEFSSTLPNYHLYSGQSVTLVYNSELDVIDANIGRFSPLQYNRTPHINTPEMVKYTVLNAVRAVFDADLDLPIATVSTWSSTSYLQIESGTMGYSEKYIDIKIEGHPQLYSVLFLRLGFKLASEYTYSGCTFIDSTGKFLIKINDASVTRENYTNYFVSFNITEA